MPEPISPSPKNAILVDSIEFSHFKQKLLLDKRTDFEESIHLRHHSNSIAQWAAKASELNLHYISVRKPYSVPKAQGMSSEEMNVNVARALMQSELKMVMFDVAKAVTHLLLAGPDIL
jgi:hypothetical protein